MGSLWPPLVLVLAVISTGDGAATSWVDWQYRVAGA